jgi:hydrogenase maturation factor
MIGMVARARLVTPQGAKPGDRVLLTKGVPIEATAILAREFSERLCDVLSAAELERAARFLYEPGISVLRDARLAMTAGRVTAMHDPTEGGLAAALWELAEASGRGLRVQPDAVPVPPLAARMCATLGLDPFAAIASGALLLTVASGDAAAVAAALRQAGVPCAIIGEVVAEPDGVWQMGSGGWELLPRPARDEIARAYEENE